MNDMFVLTIKCLRSDVVRELKRRILSYLGIDEIDATERTHDITTSELFDILNQFLKENSIDGI